MFQCIRRVEQISLPDRAVVLEYLFPSNVRAVAERNMYYRGSHCSGSRWAYLTGTLMSSSGAIASPESRGYLCLSTGFPHRSRNRTTIITKPTARAVFVTEMNTRSRPQYSSERRRTASQHRRLCNLSDKLHWHGSDCIVSHTLDHRMTEMNVRQPI